ncbi:MAG: hypothetical protein FWC13_13330 [Oscillospiraceae bacterium]|nr:hypothetical protein [Oscillospiraceae bacterium]
MTEQQALKKLGATDWRSLKKRQIMTFLFETAPRISDEVRLKILDTAPDILKTVSDMVKGYKKVAKKLFDQNHELAKAYFTICHDLAVAHEKLMSSENANYEERKFWSDRVFALLREMREFDKNNKKHTRHVLAAVGVAGIAVVGTVFAVITGGKFKFTPKL